MSKELDSLISMLDMTKEEFFIKAGVEPLTDEAISIIESGYSGTRYDPFEENPTMIPFAKLLLKYDE